MSKCFARLRCVLHPLSLVLSAGAVLTLTGEAVLPAAPLALRAEAFAPMEVLPAPVEVAESLPARPAFRQQLVASRSRPTPPGRVPRGDLPGWRQVMAEDFLGTGLPRGWDAYTGAPGGNVHGWWDPKRVAVRRGELLLTGGWQGGRYTTGGLGVWGTSMTYGKYVVRFRVQQAPGVSYALLLWPSKGGWPAAGEVDFAEDGGGARQATTATAHWSSSNRQIQHVARTDFTKWHEVGVEWTPGRLVYTLDGKPWSTVSGPAVPSGPMHLALQLEAGRGTRWSPPPSDATPDSTTLEVDWVTGYRRA